MHLEVPGPKGLPVLGNLLQLDSRKFHLHLARWADEHGKLYKMKLGPKTFVVLSDVEAIHDVVRARPHDFRRMKPIEAILTELGVHGLFAAEGEQWKRHRDLTLPSFHQKNLKPFFTTIAKMTERLEGKLDSDLARDENVELQKVFTRYTVDVTTSLAFGHDSHTLERDGDVIQKHLEILFPALTARLNSPVAYWRYLPMLPIVRRVDGAMAAIQSFCAQMIKQAEERLAKHPELRDEPSNFIEALLSASDPKVGKLSHEEVLGNVMTILVAGEDTTANALAWLFLHLVENPAAQEKIREEAAIVGRATTLDQMTKLPYAEAAAFESMRLKPVAPFLFLEPLRDVEILGRKFPKGTSMIALTSHGAVQAENFDDPTAFRPERWLAANKGQFTHHNSKAYMPFGGGARFCPGRSLALLEIKSVVSALCRRYRFSAATNGRVSDETFAFVTMPVGFFAKLERTESH